MKIAIISLSAVLVAHFVTPVYALPGESWEIVTSGEMPGMPGSMPGITTTVCLQKGAEKDPKMLSQQNDGCVISDIKSTKNKTTWKMICNKDGNEMTGVGEVNHKAGSFDGKTIISGTSDGKPVDMTATFKGRKLGTVCDTSAPVVMSNGLENLNDLMGMAKAQMASAMDEQCEVSNFHAVDLISPRYFGQNAACAGKEKFACKIIAREVARDTKVYVKLAKHDDTSDLSIATVCGIKMEDLTKKVCATVDESNYKDLADYCPTEAKAFQSEQRRPEKSGSGATGSGLLDNAIKLKGLFGF